MKLTKIALAMGLQAFSLAGCYVVPVGDNNYALYIPSHPAPVPPHLATQSAQGQPSQPRVLHARLYPDNELATQTGMVAGTVTNMMTGKGRFQLDFQGELLVGEATRVPGDDRAGLANAYGQRGTYMNCEYRMTTPYQGTGTCKLSTGAQYQVHIGD